MKKPTKWQAIKAIIFSSNYIVYTDKFIEKTTVENERLRLMSVQHERMLSGIADDELGVQ